MIAKTEAVVLKTTKYGDSSKIVRLYTRQYGKLSVIAKGARRATNRFGSALAPMNLVVAVLYKKENRDLHLLSQCDLIVSFHRLSEEMERMAAAMSVIELVDAVTHDEERNEPLFGIIRQSLEVLTTATSNAINVLYVFEVRLLELLGYKPSFHQCVQCAAHLDESAIGGTDVGWHLGKGGALCATCSGNSIGHQTLTAAGLKVLQMFQDAVDLHSVMDLTLSPPLRNEVAHILHRHFQQHVEGLRRLKAQNVFDTIL